FLLSPFFLLFFLVLFILHSCLPSTSTLFPYTTLFRSGYYINPLVSILLALIFLKERFNKLEWIAIGFAVIGVLYMTIRVIYKTRSEEHTSELQSRFDLVCRLLLEKKNEQKTIHHRTTA